MSFFQMNFERPGPGVTLPPPEKGAKRFFFLLGNHWWKVIRLNWMLLLFSLPVITAPAALTAANRVCMKLSWEGNCFLWSDFWEEFRRSFGKSLYLGVLVGLFSTVGLLSGYYSQVLFSGLMAILAGGISLAVAVYSALVGCYAFAMAAILDAPARVILKNAVLMTVAAIKTSLLLLVTVIAATAAQLLLLPYTLPLFLFITVALAQLWVCVAVTEPVKKYITNETTKTDPAD